MHEHAKHIPEGSPRSTPVRRALLEHFSQATCPLSAPELIEALAADGVQANKTTVYRQLDALVEQGAVSVVDLGEGMRRYEARRDGGEHPHLLCTRCGGVECLAADDVLAKRVRVLAAEHGFTIEGYALELYGICGTCKAAERDDAPAAGKGSETASQSAAGDAACATEANNTTCAAADDAARTAAEGGRS